VSGEFVGFDVKTRLSMLKSSAKARGINVNLSLNKYQNLINLGCMYCGINLKDEKGYCLDRLDSRQGYNITNVVPCCKICNRAKSDMDVNDFISWVKRTSKHMDKQLEVVQKMNNQGFVYSPEIEHKVHASLNTRPDFRIKVVNPLDELQRKG
jgi:hypothetical protein